MKNLEHLKTRQRTMNLKLKVLFVSQNKIKSQELVSFEPVKACVLVRILFYPSRLLFWWYCHDSAITIPLGGIPPPGRGIVGKNQSTRSKTTVRSKRYFPLKVRRGPLHCVPKCHTFLECEYWRCVVVTQTHYWLLVYLLAISHHSRYWNFFYHYW